MSRLDTTGQRRRLDGPAERELAKVIEVGVFARQCLRSGQRPRGASTEELEQLVDDGELALAQFVEANLGMVSVLARRWRRRTVMDHDELVNEGCVGLLEAIMRYDHELGWRFSTFAWNLVSQRIARHAVTNRSFGMETLAHARRGAQIEKCRAKHSARLGRPVEDEELATLMGHELASLRGTVAPTRVEMDAEELPDPAQPGTDDDVDLSWLVRMPVEERRVLTLYYGLDGNEPMTLAEIGERLELSVSGVYRLKRRALRRGRVLAEALAA